MPRGSAEPGPWRTRRTPYLFEICAAAVDPKYKRVVIVMAAQSAKTECLLNIVGHRLDDDPAPVLMVYPNQRLATSVSKSRLTPMIRSSASLLAKLDTRKTANTLTEKYIAGMRLGLAWSGSATELSSHPAALIVIDEIDRMTTDVDEEGDPVTLAEQRSTTFADAKIVIASTPTIEGASPIWSLFQQGTQHVWTVPCPECSAFFAPCFDLLKWPGDKLTPAQAKRAARLLCPACGVLIEDKHRNQMNADGRFELRGDPDSDTASYWVSGLMSPWRSWGAAAQAWVEAARSKEPGRLQAVKNTVFAELWSMEGEAPPAAKVQELRGGYAFDEVPDQARVLTAGVDVQGDRLVYVVRAWGEAQTSWLIRHGELYGDTLLENVWIDLAALLQAQYGTLTIRMTFVDSGFRPDMVYQFARRLRGVIPSKGHDTGAKPVYLARLDVNVRGEPQRRGVQLAHVDAGYFKSWVHGRITWPQDQPGAWHLPIDATSDYCEQLVAEQRVVKPNGSVKWIRTSKANHYLDAEVLATAAAHILQVHLLRPAPAAQKPAEESPAAQAPRRAQQRGAFSPGFGRPPSSNWSTTWRR